MIHFVRTAGIAPGKTATALGFAREVSAHMKASYGVEIEVLRPIGGNPQRVAWTARYKDLAAMESVNLRLLDDKAYWTLVNQASDNFIAGSIHDAIWQSV